MKNIIVFLLFFIAVASVKGDGKKLEDETSVEFRATDPPTTVPESVPPPCPHSELLTTTTTPSTSTSSPVTKKSDGKDETTAGNPTTTENPRCGSFKTTSVGKGRSKASCPDGMTDCKTKAIRKKDKNTVFVRAGKKSPSGNGFRPFSLMTSVFDDVLGHITQRMNSRKNSEPSIPTEWFKEKITQLSDAKLRSMLAKTRSMRKMPDDKTAFDQPKNTTSETFKQSLSVLKHSQLLMKVSNLLATYASRYFNLDAEKMAKKISEIANHKLNSAVALVKTDLQNNMNALRKIEKEAADTLKMLQLLSSGARKRSADIPDETVMFDVMKTKENALEVTEELAGYLTRMLAKNETANVAEIVDSALSVY